MIGYVRFVESGKKTLKKKVKFVQFLILYLVENDLTFLKQNKGDMVTKLKNAFFTVLLLSMIFSSVGFSQVLGLCGSQNENDPATATKSDVQSVLRPGDKAVNFELTAVVGNDIKKVKLSDYNGKWRVVCFYPADFTFV